MVSLILRLSAVASARCLALAVERVFGSTARHLRADLGPDGAVETLRPAVAPALEPSVVSVWLRQVERR